MHLDQGVVAWVQPVQHRHVAGDQVASGGAERRAAGMADEDARRRDAAPAEMAGAQAEVVFLAVALGEHIFPQQANRVEAVAPEIQAEADAGRQILDGSAVGLLRQGISGDDGGEVRHRVAAVPAGVAEDGGVVGQRRRGADIRRAVCGGAQTNEPARRHQRVAVQQHHVPTGAGA